MGGSTLLRSLLWSLLVLSAVAHAQGLRHLHFRQDDVNGTSAASASASAASSAVLSSTLFSSSSSSRSSSFSRQIPSSSPAPSSSSSSLSSVSSSPSSSSTSTTTASSISPSSSSVSSVSFSSSSPVSSTSTKTTVSVKGGVANPQPTQPQHTASTDSAPDPTDTDDQPTSTDDGSLKSNVNAASSGFWGNKGKVGATFTIVALVIVGLLAGVLMILRRRRAAHNSARDTFFDTKGPMDRAERQPSPEPSMASLRNEPLDAHATPVPNYGSADQYLVDMTDYNVSYPPGAAYAPTADSQQQYYTDSAPAQQQYYADNAAPQQQYYTDQHTPTTADQLHPSAAAHYADGTAYESYNQYYSTPDGGSGGNGNVYGVSPTNNRPSLSPHPYSHPLHASGVPPNALREVAGRDSYQPSIDSFYGAAGTAH